MIPAAIFVGAVIYILIGVGTCVGIINHTNKQCDSLKQREANRPYFIQIFF